MSGILPTFVTASDVDAIKARVKAALTGTDLSVQSCPAITDSVRAAWGTFYGAVLGFCQSESSTWTAAAEANRGEAYERELFDWQKKLTASGCSLGVPLHDPGADPGRDSFMQLAKYATVVVTAVAGAYVVGQLFSVASAVARAAPVAPRPRAAAPRRRYA